MLDFELAGYAKYLILASYLASYNDSKYDEMYFSSSGHKKRKKGGAADAKALSKATKKVFFSFRHKCVNHQFYHRKRFLKDCVGLAILQWTECWPSFVLLWMKANCPIHRIFTLRYLTSYFFKLLNQSFVFASLSFLDIFVGGVEFLDVGITGRCVGYCEAQM